MRVAVLKGGRSLERNVSLRSGARVEDALHKLGHEVVPIDVGADLVDRLVRGARRTSPSSPCTAAAARTARCRSCSSWSASPTPPPARRRASAAWTRWWPSTSCAPPGCRRPTSTPSATRPSRSSGAARALPALEERLDFPIVVKPAAQGSALGIKFARTAADVPGAIVAAFSYDTKVLLERYVDGRDLAVSVLDGEALPVVEAVPQEEDFYDFEARYEIGRTAFICPALIGDETTARAQELALAAYRTLGCRGFARVDLMLDGAGELTLLEINAIPGLTDTSLLPLAAEAAGIPFDELIARIVDLAVARTPA